MGRVTTGGYCTTGRVTTGGYRSGRMDIVLRGRTKVSGPPGANDQTVSVSGWAMQVGQIYADDMVFEIWQKAENCAEAQ